MSARKTRKRKPEKSQVAICETATDFYSLKNRHWLVSTKIPPSEARITQAYFIREDIRKELRAVIDSQKVGPIHDLMTIWKAAEKDRVPNGLTPVLQMMMAAATPSDISNRIGWMNRHGIGAPLSVYVQGDPREHRRCRIFIEEGSPRIGIPEYWLWPEYADHRRAYRAYVRRLATILDIPRLEEGVVAEAEFAEMYPPANQRRRRINMLSWKELNETYTTLDWTALFTAWGLRVDELPHILYNVTSPAFVHHIQARMKRWDSTRWSMWLALIVAQWAAACSPHGPLRSAMFAYNFRYIQGMPTDDANTDLRYAIIQSAMPTMLGRLWVQDHCAPTLKRTVTAMAERIRDAAASQLAKTSWMAPSTRKEAIRKLRSMDVEICWPDEWTEAPLDTVALRDQNIVNAFLTINALSTDYNIGMLRKGDCRSPSGNGWGRPVFEVNAFYYPDENRFLLPAAILRPPFYDTTKSTTWNYGAIGATIGHELCHAFDADGRHFDRDGNQRDWWTKRDTGEYKKREASVVDLFESRKYRGMNVDGSLTVVENIADIGGLEFALGGLRLTLHRDLTKAEKREFFEAYAVSWRAKDRMKRAAELLARDPHAPPMLRVNHVVRQFDEWYDAFDVPATCEDYIPPEKRIRFFR
jgi:putative endopeptidase